MALLTPDLVLIDANEQFLKGAGCELEDIVGHNIFERFPKMPPDPGGEPTWTALEAALTSGQREVDHLSRYDVEDPEEPGVFDERYWSSVVTPIRDEDGQIEVLELSTREVTAIIDEYRRLQSEQ
jgi:PAS domain-containing protein